MGIFDKLMFWKKSDSLGIGDFKGFGSETLPKDREFGTGGIGKFPQDQTAGLGGTPDLMDTELKIKGTGFEGEMSQSGIGEERSYEREGFAAPKQPRSYNMPESSGKDYEIVSSKLDMLRAMLDSISHRLSVIEREIQRKGGW